jgi:hypothetical protein
MWLLALIFLSSGLLLILFLVRNKSVFPMSSAWTVGDIVQLAGIVLTILALAIAFSALQLTLTAARQTEQELKKQQAGLDASKKAIDTIIEAVQNQNNVIESNVAVSKVQLELIQRQAELQQERLARKPFVDLYYGGGSVDELASPVRIRKSGESIALRFVVRNNGDAAAQRGMIVVIADPSTFEIDQEGAPKPERRSLHRLQVGMHDLLSYTPTHDEFSLDLALHGSIPEEFTLSFSVFGENFEAVRRRINFRVSP